MSPFLAAAIATMLTDSDESRCDLCGFQWEISAADAVSMLAEAPPRYETLLGSTSSLVSSRQGWSASAYVWHVGDVVRAWSERLHALVHAPDQGWAGFDPDVLAAARDYANLPVVTAPWALGVAVGAVLEVLDELTPETTFEHPEWGPGSVTDALRWVAHEAVHHQVDVTRLAGPRG